MTDDPKDPSLAQTVLDSYQDLMGPLYAIQSSTALLAGETSVSERRRLISSTVHACGRLEQSVARIVEKAGSYTGSFLARPRNTSIRSMTLEAALSLTDVSGKPRVSAEIQGADAIVNAEHARLVSMLGSALQYVGERGGPVRLLCSITYVDGVDGVDVLWEVLSDKALGGLQVIDPYTVARTEANRSFINLVAGQLGVKVEVVSPEKTRLSTRISTVLRQIDDQEHFDDADWNGVSVVQHAQSPDDMLSLPVPSMRMDLQDDLPSRLSAASATVLVLRLTDPVDDEQLSSNLYFSQNASVPVVLCSNALSYEQFVLFREHVDAIISEPLSEPTLARYLIGLSLLNRRREPRPAVLY